LPSLDDNGTPVDPNPARRRSVQAKGGVRDHARVASAASEKRQRDAALRLWADPGAKVPCPVNGDAEIRAYWLPGSKDGRQGSLYVECPTCGWSMNIRAKDPPDGLSTLNPDWLPD
jgi:hypothetical protein